MTEREDFNVTADRELHQALLTARRAGRRHGGKLFSCTMAFELGAKILLGLEESEEEVIKQDIEDIKAQKAALEQKERMRLEQLQMMEVSRAAKVSDASGKNNNVQRLAQRILDIWDNVIIYKKYALINGLVEIDKDRLTKERIEAVFPKIYAPKPTIEDAVLIATNLLKYDGEGVDV
jgi:hypothetical protein